MKILHAGIFSPHVIAMMRLLWRCDQTLMQEVVLPGQVPMLDPDLVFCHGFHEYPGEVERYLSWGVPVVARPWNDRWLSRPGQREQVLGLLPRLSLVVGSPFSKLKAEHGACLRVVWTQWCDVTTLVDTDVFKPVDGLQPAGSEIRFFAARLIERDPEGVYWGDEIRRAMAGLELYTVSGHASPNQMADQMRRSVVVLSLCGTEWGPSDTSLEAIFCGKVPVLADTPANRIHFPDGIGARFATRDPHSIRQACIEVLEMSAEERARENAVARERFAGWTLQAQAERIGGAVLGCVRAEDDWGPPPEPSWAEVA